jgi:hypothetical protein
MEEMPPPTNFSPPLNRNPEIDPPRAYSPDHFFGIGSCMVKVEIPPNWQDTPLNIMVVVDMDDIVDIVDTEDAAEAADATKEMDVDMMEESPSSTPLRFAEEHTQLIFELRKKMNEQAHI